MGFGRSHRVRTPANPSFRLESEIRRAFHSRLFPHVAGVLPKPSGGVQVSWPLPRKPFPERMDDGGGGSGVLLPGPMDPRVRCYVILHLYFFCLHLLGDARTEVNLLVDFTCGLRLTTRCLFLLWSVCSSTSLHRDPSSAAPPLIYLSLSRDRMLNAGPMVVIVTALVLIFTIGLGDDDSRAGPSAYSVFNRGFERLLGSVDADSLLAQHVGGGAGMMMMMNNNDNDIRHDAIDDRDGAGRDMPRRAAGQVPPRQPGDDVHAANHNQDQHRGGHNNDGDGQQGGGNEQNGDNVNNRARKSGKKARRRNLDQRRDIRRQQDAALRMEMDPEETIEMQLLIEAQIAAETNNGDN